MAAAVSSTEEKTADIIGANRSDHEFQTSLAEFGLRLNENGFIRWGNDNPKHPRNWSGKAKAYNAVIILLLEFITSAVGTAGTAAAQSMQDDFDVDLALSIFCLTSTYLIGQGIGGVFFPPYSEIFGRKTLYIVSTFIYCIFSIITASVHALPAIIIARFLSGLASAVPTIVVAGSMEDLFNTRARVWMIFIWAVIGNAAVCVGPIYSAYVTQSVGWRWVFYMAAIGLGVLLGFCFSLRETRPSLLLEREVSVLRKHQPSRDIKTLNPDVAPDFHTLIVVTLLRPLRLLFTEPIIMAVAFMGSITCALFYLQAESIPLVFEAYGWSTATASLGFVPVLLGCLFSSLTRFYDHHHLATIIKGGRAVEPEDKLRGFALAAPCLAGGLWLFAWTIPPLTSVHWMVPMIAQFFVGFALNENVYTLTGYLADSYTIYAASGFAGLILARASTCAIIVPFTRAMYVNLGYNVATSILAAIATLFCVAPVVFLRYGKRIREASVFAKLSLTTYRENRVEDDMDSC
ncbi:MFS general substrate transporter [Aspergillus ibericus CBS 121593]|uniref:MFS general substrate transporter n=1 Tax=Aspergillus ibericus CBS 121593 TaxID=1448316 RepID=A0A395GL91_9EURO|nr:MFS general substrate transporter [Aspergillus ibericus CBS 121593]RAK96239.1 MFS general substrate transporter [Aspergillus ibericus CBS 121593]